MAIVALHGGVWRQSSLLGANAGSGGGAAPPLWRPPLPSHELRREARPRASALAATLGAVLLTALAVRRRAGSEQCRP